MSVCLGGFCEKLLTIHVKAAEGIIMKFHSLGQMSSNLPLYLYNVLIFDPKRWFGRGGRTNGNYQITPNLIALWQILL